MAWIRARTHTMAGVFCLAGMGTLLFMSGRGVPYPQLEQPWLFLLLTVVLAVVLGLGGRDRSFSWRLVSLTSITLLFAIALGALVQSVGPAQGHGRIPGDVISRLSTAKGVMSGLEPALERMSVRISNTHSPLSYPSFNRGDPFRLIQGWPDIWAQEFSGAREVPLRAVLWRDGQRLAWTEGVKPIPFESAATDSVQTRRLGRLELVQGRSGGLLRYLIDLDGGLGVELQLPLEEGGVQARWPQVVLEVLPTSEIPLLFGKDGEEFPDAIYCDESSGLSLRLAIAGLDQDVRSAAMRLRWLLAAFLFWLVVSACALYGFYSWLGLLVALWVGRLLLAVTGFFRLFGPAFPELVFPARPASVAGLIDPAYFATPFFYGFFASAADALLTAGLASYTIWRLFRYLNLLEDGRRELRELEGKTKEDPTQAPFQTPAPSSAPTVAMALVSGLVTGSALLALRFFGGLVAENSNARLIGDGVSLSSLSFWALHVVLMLAGLGLLVLAAVPAKAAGQPDRGNLGRWFAGSLLAVVGAVLVGAPFGGLTWVGRMLIGGGGFALFWIIPALSSRPRFLRRLAWPCLLLVVVCWNYLSLWEVYSRAERAWLERKGQLITESAEDWMLFLLEDTLQGMRQAEVDLVIRAGKSEEIWRDEAAYLLWNKSALKDLGYSCLVEMIDADGEEESLFATARMKSFEYSVAGRSPWVDAAGEGAPEDWDMIFQTEERIYPDGRELVLAGETPRSNGRGWIRVEVPVKSDRITSLQSDLTGQSWSQAGAYRPRAEVDRPVLVLRGDRDGWRAEGGFGFPGLDAEKAVAALQSGERTWATIRLGGTQWLCRWESLPEDWSLGQGDGFLLGLKLPGFRAGLLDLSRLLLLNLVLFFLLQLLILALGVGGRFLRRHGIKAKGKTFGGTLDKASREASGHGWRPGFQERFLAGYLLLGLVLLAVVGMSVDKVGQDRIREEARNQTRAGLSLAVQQLRSLLVEQARSLAASEYIADLLVGQLSGQRPVGPLERQQGMVFDGEGTLLLDETLSDLSGQEASELLAAGREAPFLLIREGDLFYVGTVIPIDLGDVWAATVLSDSLPGDPGHGPAGTNGFFLYRQRFDSGLLGGLAELARGQATLRVDGRPVFASHPARIFAGREPLLTEPWIMAELMAHPVGAGVFAARGRHFAFSGCQPLPSFSLDAAGNLSSRTQPAVLGLAFPDREREYVAQRRATGLFLAGLANLILLTALVLALFLSWSIFRPLRLLLAATRSLARGDFEAPLPFAGADEVGRLSGAFGLMRSQLHSARDRLAAREQFLATVLGRVPVGVAVLGVDGSVLTLNPAGREILAAFNSEGEEPGSASGYVAGQISDPISDQVSTQVSDQMSDLLDRFRQAAPGSTHSAVELRSVNGKCTLRGAIAPLELSGGRNDTMLVFEDITEFLQTKMMAINAELARQVAHEIKNPLTPIQLTIQLLDQAWRDGHPQLDSIVKDTVSRVLEQVSLLRTIASEFSLLGRPDEPEISVLDLKEQVTRAVAAYVNGSFSGEESLPRVNIQDGRFPLVLGHEESLQKILGNLMQNSLDAAPAGSPAVIDVSWRAGTDTVILFWRDRGLGIPAEVADRLFDPYFSTKSSGTGLGLAICRNLADRMGGTITLGPPSEGSGAQAELTLPAAPAQLEDS